MKERNLTFNFYNGATLEFFDLGGDLPAEFFTFGDPYHEMQKVRRLGRGKIGRGEKAKQALKNQSKARKKQRR